MRPFFLMNSIVHWLENNLISCPYKSMSGMDCPGCGMQRSLVELLKGNFMMSLELYPALLPVLFTLIYTVLHIIFKFKNGAAIIKYSFIATMTIITIKYIYKMST